MISQPIDAFFYGTLLHPRILLRVIGNDGSHLQISPALLRGYTRHQIRAADYPAIIPYAWSRTLSNQAQQGQQGRERQEERQELPPDEQCVRGTLVRGLTESDIEFLDLFEGNEYTRETVPVHPLSDFTSLSRSASGSGSVSDVAPTSPPPVPDLDTLPAAVPAQTYVWCMPLSKLSPDVWSYETFMKQNAHKWVGPESDREDYLVVEQRRELIGGIVKAVGQRGEVTIEET